MTKVDRKSWLYIHQNQPQCRKFDLEVEVAKIYNYINELPVRLAVNLAEKSLKEKFAKELSSYM